jgi:iron complex outermembrane receptor protein
MRDVHDLDRFLALAALLLALPGGAQEPPAPKQDEEPPRFEDAVDVEAELPALPAASGAATRDPVSVMDVPATISVVPRRLLDQQEVFILNEALRNASGVNTGTGFGVFDFFVVRGFDSLSSGVVLTDGVPEPEATFYPLYNVRQVEVVKGPAAFLYGGGPLAGAVHIVRKQPQPKRFADLALVYGRFDTFAGTLDANAASADASLAFRLNGAYQGTDHYRDLPRGSIGALNPALAWRPDPGTRVLLNFEYARSEWPPDTGIPFAGSTGPELVPVPRTRSYQSPLDGSQQDVLRFRIDGERQLGERVTLRNRLYFTQLEWDSAGTLVSGVFDVPGGRPLVARTLTRLDDRQRLLGDQLELRAGFATGGIDHQLLAGVELVRLTDRFAQEVGLLPPLDLLSPSEGAPPPVLPLPQFGARGDARSHVVAPYVIDRLRASKRLQVFLGGRLDALDYDEPRSQTQRSDTRLSPLLGLVYSPQARLALHASWGRAFAAPSSLVTGPREPERSRQLEAGAKLEFLDGRAFAGLAVYQLERDNIAVPDRIGFLRQNGDQRSRGLELDLSSEIAKDWLTYAHYAFTDAKLLRFSELVALQPPAFTVLDRSGHDTPFAPRHLFGVWTSYALGHGFGVSAGLRASSDQFIAEDNRFRIGGYATLEAGVSYEAKPARFSMNFKNLTGTEYETRGFGAVSAIPARPFEIVCRVEFRVGSR